MKKFQFVALSFNIGAYDKLNKAESLVIFLLDKFCIIYEYIPGKTGVRPDSGET